jgi:hypothetical protein
MTETGGNTSNPTDERLWIPQETAAFLRVAVKQLVYLEREEGLPVHDISLGTRPTRRYVPAEVRAWLRSKCSSPDTCMAAS